MSTYNAEEEALKRPYDSMGRLTTHVLDAAHGVPGHNVEVKLYRLNGEERTLVNTVLTNDDGRCDAPVLEGEEFKTGIYELVFGVAAYYRAKGVELPTPAFLEEVAIRFGIANEEQHYHVPLNVSPYAYTTYRGS